LNSSAGLENAQNGSNESHALPTFEEKLLELSFGPNDREECFVIRNVSNVLWHFPFFGFISAAIYFAFGFLFSVTVVGLPLGLGLIEWSKFLLAPGTRSLITVTDLPKKPNFLWRGWSFLVAVIYFPIGLVLAILNVCSGIGLLCTIIGIPTGLDILRATGAVLAPSNKKCVRRTVAEELSRRRDAAAATALLGEQ
jgi:uncharacterized membrane protein YccF (DUF307 family)